MSLWAEGSKSLRKERASAAVVNRTEELKNKILLLCYGKEIRNRKGAGLFVEQRGPFSLFCELACKVVSIIPSLLLFTFLRDFGGNPSGCTLAFGSVSQKGAAFADGGWTTTYSLSLLVVPLVFGKKLFKALIFAVNYATIATLSSG